MPQRAIRAVVIGARNAGTEILRSLHRPRHRHRGAVDPVLAGRDVGERARIGTLEAAPKLLTAD